MFDSQELLDAQLARHKTIIHPEFTPPCIYEYPTYAIVGIL